MFLSPRFLVVLTSFFVVIGLGACSDKDADKNANSSSKSESSEKPDASAKSGETTAPTDVKAPGTDVATKSSNPTASAVSTEKPAAPRPGRSDADLLQVLKNNGYHHAQLVKPGTIRIRTEGDSYLLFNKANGSLRLYYKYQGSSHITSEQLKHWNQDEWPTNAHFDSDHSPALARNHKISDGLGDHDIIGLVQDFHDSVTRYQRLIEPEHY